MTPRNSDRRWPWYQQVVDAAVAALGFGITVTMAARNSWPPLGVIMALVCLGRLTSSAALRYLLARWEGGGGNGRR